MRGRVTNALLPADAHQQPHLEEPHGRHWSGNSGGGSQLRLQVGPVAPRDAWGGAGLSLLPPPSCVVPPRSIGVESKELSPDCRSPQGRLEPSWGLMAPVTVRAVLPGGRSVAGAVTPCPAWFCLPDVPKLSSRGCCSGPWGVHRRGTHGRFPLCRGLLWGAGRAWS